MSVSLPVRIVGVLYLIFLALWAVASCDAGQPSMLRHAPPALAAESEAPGLALLPVVIGWGAPNKANSHEAHGAPLGAEEVKLKNLSDGSTVESGRVREILTLLARLARLPKNVC